jgi:hypothetical protein
LTSFAAGAVIAMLAEAMIPEAFEKAPPFIGFITVVGFLYDGCTNCPIDAELHERGVDREGSDGA